MFPSASAEILKALAFFWPSRQASFTMKAATSSAGTARCRLAVEPIWLGKPAASRISAVTCKKVILITILSRIDTVHYTIENLSILSTILSRFLNTYMICCVGLGKSPVPLRQEVGEVDPRGVALQRQLMAGRGGGGGRNREGVGPSQDPEENDRAVMSKNTTNKSMIMSL